MPRLRRGLRLGSGLVLFAYLALHLFDHSLGLVSLAVAERGLALAVGLWHSGAGTAALYGAAAIHVALAFDALWGRRSLRMAPLDSLRVLLGFAIPTLLIGHVVGTRLAWELYQQAPRYERVVWSLWRTEGQGLQLALLVPGWLHGCLGLHLAFAHRPAYRRMRLLLFGAALALPLLGALGFLAMGRELAADPAGHARLDAALALPAERSAWLVDARQTVLAIYLGAVALVFAARRYSRAGPRH